MHESTCFFEWREVFQYPGPGHGHGLGDPTESHGSVVCSHVGNASDAVDGRPFLTFLFSSHSNHLLPSPLPPLFYPSFPGRL